MQKNFIPILCFAVLAILASPVSAEELEMINRPVNYSGLTGLLFTTAPFTMPAHALEVSAAGLSEKSSEPNYSLNELPSVTITYGMTDTSELALKGSYFHKTVGTGNEERGAGDTELSYKWNFLRQEETSSWPAVALIVTGLGPGSNREMNVRQVSHWGARIGLSAGREVLWGDHVIAIYADGRIAVRDLSDAEFRDRFGLLNAGLIFPISKNRNLQMLIEYNMVTGVDRLTATGGDYGAITYGLRLVNERFNLSIGTQFLNKEPQGFGKSSRIIGMMSIKL